MGVIFGVRGGEINVAWGDSTLPTFIKKLAYMVWGPKFLKFVPT